MAASTSGVETVGEELDMYDNVSDFSDFDKDLLNLDQTFDRLVNIKETSEDDGRTFCTCNSILITDMLACSNESCPIQWWHYECVDMTAATVPADGTWYSSLCCQTNEGKFVS